MSDVKDWETSAGANSDPAPNGFPEGMPPSGVNDASREVMAAIKRFYEQIGTERLVMGVPVYELDVIAPNAITADTIAVNSVGMDKLVDNIGGTIVGTIKPTNDGLKSPKFMSPAEAKTVLAITAAASGGDVAGLGSLAFANSATTPANSVGMTQLKYNSTNTVTYIETRGSKTVSMPSFWETRLTSGGLNSLAPTTEAWANGGECYFNTNAGNARTYNGGGSGGNNADISDSAATSPAGNQGLTIGIHDFFLQQSDAGGDYGFGRTERIIIDASPPWNMGNGDCSMFLYVKFNADGHVIGTSQAGSPVWGYNGKTSVIPDKIEELGGGKVKKLKLVRKGVGPKKPTEGGSIEEYLEWLKHGETEYVEIDQEIKNRDMDDIPHPFAAESMSTNTNIMIDPASSMADDLRILQIDGENLHDILERGYIDFEPRPTSGIIIPKGVDMRAAKWKNTGGKKV